MTKNLTDLRSEPDHHSERASQLRFGEIVAIGATRQGFGRITQSDGYRGWVDMRFLEIIESRPKVYRGSLQVVSALTAPVFDVTGHGVSPYFLYFGTRVRVSGRNGPRSICRLPDGGRFQIATKALAKAEFKKSHSAVGQLLREARRFLGVPYLWGGISPAGFDCSGFVQALFARFGIVLPRDTKDQIHAGIEIEAANVRPGDLLFFRRHVGIAMGRGRLIHASRGGGGLAVNSLRPDDDEYRKDLHDTFVTARRIL